MVLRFAVLAGTSARRACPARRAGATDRPMCLAAGAARGAVSAGRGHAGGRVGRAPRSPKSGGTWPRSIPAERRTSAPGRGEQRRPRTARPRRSDRRCHRLAQGRARRVRRLRLEVASPRVGRLEHCEPEFRSGPGRCVRRNGDGARKAPPRQCSRPTRDDLQVRRRGCRHAPRTARVSLSVGQPAPPRRDR